MGSKAREVHKLLHGIICTYKPPGTSVRYVISKLKSNICAELNSLETAPARTYYELDKSGDHAIIKSRPSYADHVLCSGPRYQPQHFTLIYPTSLSDLMSGVFVLGINEGNILARLLMSLKFTNCFHLKGILGQATENFHIDTKVVAKANYKKVTRDRFENILASYQSITQRKMFEEYGYFLHTQEAYDFAVEGLFRPRFKGQPIIYSMKLVDFQPPHFTLEVQCIHSTEVFLLNFIHNLGLNLRCYATCSSVRCIRYGCFHVEDSIVKEQWNLDEITKNIQLCWDILEKHYSNNIEFSKTVETIKRTAKDCAG